MVGVKRPKGLEFATGLFWASRFRGSTCLFPPNIGHHFYFCVKSYLSPAKAIKRIREKIRENFLSVLSPSPPAKVIYLKYISTAVDMGMPSCRRISSAADFCFDRIHLKYDELNNRSIRCGDLA